MKNFCPKCGKSEDKKTKFINGFCKQCYLEDHELISYKPEIQIEQCQKCAKVRIRGKWLEPDFDLLKKYILKHIILDRVLKEPEFRVMIHPPSDVNYRLVIVKISAKINKRKEDFELSMKLVPHMHICNDCNKIGSQYFNAIIQIRLTKKDKELMKKIDNKIHNLSNQLQRKDTLAAIVKTSILKKIRGKDYYIGSKNAAKSMVDELKKMGKVEVKESFKLITVDKSGRDLKRVTYSVRFLE